MVGYDFDVAYLLPRHQARMHNGERKHGMNRHLVLLSVWILGLLVSFPVSLTAQGTKTVVRGVGDFADGLAPAETGFLRWSDSGGRTHINNLVARGNFALTGEDIDLAGKWELLFSVFHF